VLVEKLGANGPQPAAVVRSSGSQLWPSSPAPTERVIIHLDMDAFFATVAGLTHPSLRDKPLAVSHSNSNAGTSGGEISSCNYPARARGVRAGMWMGEAKQLCPELLVMPYQFDRYQEISDRVYSIMLKYSAAVQPVSCDEAFLDVTGLGEPTDIAASMRKEIEEQTGGASSNTHT
jgi:DNA repair protein REV1